MGVRAAVAALAAALALAAPAIARADGTAIPDTVQFMASSGSPNEVALNATFGFLFSQDAGAHWSWTCHEAIIGGASFTPHAQRAPDGTAWVAVPLGLATATTRSLWRSADRGCNWSSIASLDGVVVRDLAFQPGSAVVVAIGADAAGTNALAWRSIDGGASFGAPALTASAQIFTEARFAPGDASRLYVSAISTTASAAFLWRSTNGGLSFRELPLPSFGAGDPQLRVVAVSPSNPDVVWLRADLASDALFVSTDGGIDVSLALTVPGDLAGVAYTAGNRLFAAVKRTNGVYAASGSTGPFAPILPSPAARCLDARGADLFVCGDPGDPRGFAPGTITTDGATFDTEMSFSRITGPESCPAGSLSATVCDPLWPALALRLGLNATPTPTPGPAGHGGGGCGCDLPGTTEYVPALGTAGLLLLLALRRTCRRTP